MSTVKLRQARTMSANISNASVLSPLQVGLYRANFLKVVALIGGKKHRHLASGMEEDILSTSCDEVALFLHYVSSRA